jgi:hypothetical protein
MLNFTVTVITIDTVTMTSAATARRPWCFGGGAVTLGGGDGSAGEVHSSDSAVGRVSRSIASLLQLTLTEADAADDRGSALADGEENGEEV